MNPGLRFIASTFWNDACIMQSDLTLTTLYEANARHDPDAAAIMAPGRTPLSNQCFYDLVVTTVEALNRLGIGRDNRVAVVASGGPLAATAYAAISCGTTCTVLNPASTTSEFKTLFEQMKIDTLVHLGDSVAVTVAQTCGLNTIALIARDGDEAGWFTLRGDSTRSPVTDGFARPDDLAMLLPTSGTTGSSKIVPVTHRTMIARLGPNLGEGVFPKGPLLHTMPMFHYSGQGYLVRMLAAGSGLICLPGFEIASFFDALEEFKPVGFGGVATMFQSIVAQADWYKARLRGHSLRYIRADGMSLPARLKDAMEALFGVPVVQLYASTETGIVAMCGLERANCKPGTVGKPFHSEVRIVDEERGAVAIGQIGEIIVRGASVFNGYERNPAANADAFRDGWYHTGDVGCFDPDGDLSITGRIKEIINRGGQKVSPAEVERVIETHPAVSEAAVFGIWDESMGEEIAAAIIARDSQPLSINDLRLFMGTFLAEYKIPRHILFVDELPRTSLGKIERYKLTERYKGISATEKMRQSDSSEARTPVERALVGLWSSILGKPESDIGIGDTFQGLGGTSLSAARLIVRMRDTFQISIKLVNLFDAPTIREQAVVVEQLQASGATPPNDSGTLIPLRVEGNRPPLYCTHALEGGIMMYQQLAAYLDPEQPVFGLQAVGFDDDEAPLDSIDAMSRHHVAQIEAVQKNGPYLLVGYSMGGRIALEIGRKLREKGHQAVHVLMIDDHLQANAYVKSASTPLRWTRSRKVNRAYSILFAMFRMPRRYRLRYLRERCAYVQTALRLIPDQSAAVEKLDVTSFPDSIRRVIEASARAVKTYVPRPYDGDLTYLRADDDSVAIRMFRALEFVARGPLTLIDIPGTHVSVLREPNVRVTARAVQAWLDRVSG